MKKVVSLVVALLLVVGLAVASEVTGVPAVESITGSDLYESKVVGGSDLELEVTDIPEEQLADLGTVLDNVREALSDGKSVAEAFGEEVKAALEEKLPEGIDLDSLEIVDAAVLEGDKDQISGEERVVMKVGFPVQFADNDKAAVLFGTYNDDILAAVWSALAAEPEDGKLNVAFEPEDLLRWKETENNLMLPVKDGTVVPTTATLPEGN